MVADGGIAVAVVAVVAVGFLTESNLLFICM